MHFDVPKFVRSPGCDHRHDKESRNGRDIKIDILEAYIWISETFPEKPGFFRSTGGLPEPPPRGVIGPRWAMREKRSAGQGRPLAPSPPSPNRTRRRGGGRRPPFLFPLPPSPNRIRRGGRRPPFLLLLHFFPLFSYSNKEGRESYSRWE